MPKRPSAASTRLAWTISRSRLACKAPACRAAVLALAALVAAGPAQADSRADNAIGTDAACRAGSHQMARVELYFGGRPNDRATWRKFLATEVTPLFPAGLTTFDGSGQWRDGVRRLREPAHILIIFYKPDPRADAKIEAIRRAYKSQFRQKSVLRADSTACVGF